MRLQADWLEAAATAPDASTFCHELEERGDFVRIDPSVEPGIWRGATISRSEVAALQTIERIVRDRRVTRIGPGGLTLADGDHLPAAPGEVFVDCTAAGTPPVPSTPAFEPGRIGLRYLNAGLPTWGAAIIAAVEASGADEATKNALCVPVPFSGEAGRLLEVAYAIALGEIARSKDADLITWNQTCRLNPARGAVERMGDDPELVTAFTTVLGAIGPAVRNLRAQSAATATPD
jgi:hypothetical protein